MEMGGLRNRFATVAAKEVAPIPLEEAARLFEWLADKEELAFGYPEEGCCARTHLMCQELMDRGLAPKKAWATESEKQLHVSTLAEKDLYFWYHVAPSLSVRLPDGTVQDMVFDPSLFDGPVSLAEWGDIMEAKTDHLEITPLGVAPHGLYKGKKAYGDYGGEANTYDDADEESKDIIDRIMKIVQEKKDPTVHQDWQRIPRNVFQSRTLQNAARDPFKPRTRGATWQTVGITPQRPAAAPAARPSGLSQ